MPDPVKKPHNREKVEAVAWLVALGEPIGRIAKTTKISDNTIRNWLASDWWVDELDKARELIPRHIMDRAMAGVLRGLGDPDEYATMSRWAAERLSSDFTPPVQRKDHTSDGNPIQMPPSMEVVLVRADDSTTDGDEDE